MTFKSHGWLALGIGALIIVFGITVNAWGASTTPVPVGNLRCGPACTAEAKRQAEVAVKAEFDRRDILLWHGCQPRCAKNGWQAYRAAVEYTQIGVPRLRCGCSNGAEMWIFLNPDETIPPMPPTPTRVPVPGLPP